MTDHRDIDQIASALLDGTLPPDEAVIAARDPEIAARVDELRTIVEALRDVPPPTVGGRDRAIAAAVAAFDADEATTARAGVPGASVLPGRHATDEPSSDEDRAVVTELGKRRGLRWPPPAWLGAAAAILAIALAVGFLARADRDDDHVASDAPADIAPAAEEAEGGAEAGAAPDAGGGDAAGADERAAAPIDLGSVGSVDELRGDVLALLPAAEVQANADTTTTLDEDANGSRFENPAGDDATALMPARDPDVACPALLVGGDPGRGEVVLAATARYRGATVAVHVYEADDILRLVATDADCTDVVDALLNG